MMTETVVNVQEAPNNNAANKPQQPGAPRQPESPLAWIKINLEYFKTTPGLLKLAELILGIFCMALASPAYIGATHFFLTVATLSFILTIIWIFVYLLGVREALRIPINWILSELVNTALWGGAYIIAFIVQLIEISPYYSSSWRARNIAAGVFGLFNSGVYCFASYLLYLEWKGNKTTN